MSLKWLTGSIEKANTYLLDMPTSIKAFVKSNHDGSYTIIINARLSDEEQKKAYLHELRHIENGDFERKCSADLIEFYAHGGD